MVRLPGARIVVFSGRAVATVLPAGAGRKPQFALGNLSKSRAKARDLPERRANAKKSPG